MAFLLHHGMTNPLFVLFRSRYLCSEKAIMILRDYKAEIGTTRTGKSVSQALGLLRFSLCIGEISDILDMQRGVHLVRLICILGTQGIEPSEYVASESGWDGLVGLPHAT